MPEIVKKSKVTAVGFAAKAKQAQAEAEKPSNTNVPNRLGLMLDDSGSMTGMVDEKSSKLDLLKKAAQGFVTCCDWSNTRVAMYPIADGDGQRIALTDSAPLIIITALNFQAGSSTPMGRTMTAMLESEPITRGIIVSDGGSTDDVESPTQNYVSAGVPVDCIHIGDSSAGEDTLKRIAELTGGIYLKFTDVNSFAKSMMYLTPKYRAMLQASGAAQLVGADEIKI